jgi:hypothetical protein
VTGTLKLPPEVLMDGPTGRQIGSEPAAMDGRTMTQVRFASGGMNLLTYALLAALRTSKRMAYAVWACAWSDASSNAA